MNQSQVIVVATPVFLVLMALEFAWGYRRQLKGTGHNTYRLNDTLNSLSLGVLSQLGAVFSKALTVGIYAAIQGSVALVNQPAFWSSWIGVLLALVFYDFCYYWLHRSGHRVAILWAAHVVHHQSQHYNLSTALRQTSSGALLGWVFYVPMAIAGVPPLIFGIVALIDLLYQFWVHTEQVGRLGWFDRVFCSPSNHRVHHAVNDDYLDKNYGGVLVLWDRLFGTFREESAKCVYGTRSPLNSWDPLWANAEVYWALFQDAWHTGRWPDKARVFLKPPGWRPVDVAARFPKPEFTLAEVRRFDPPAARGTQWFAAVQFVVLLAGVSAVLWFSGSAAPLTLALGSMALAACYWAIGAVLQGRIHWLEVLLIEAAALATVTSALGLLEWHRVFKPATMVIAIIFIGIKAIESPARSRFYLYFTLALTASLAGDVLLMLPGQWFTPGLASFLVAHLFYIALYQMAVGWFPSKAAVVSTLVVGAAMLGWLWGGLPDPVLKVAVTAYVGVIALMAAQAIGRARALGDTASRLVGVGACIFMLSDALIAINRFVQPIPLVGLWVLASYYAAQILMIHNARPEPGTGQT